LFFFLFPGDAHRIVSVCFVNAAFHAGSREPCRTKRDERCHSVQQEKQAKVTLQPEEATRWGNPQSEQQEKQAEVTLEPEESVGGSRKERNALSVQFGLRGDWGFAERLCGILFSKYEQLARHLTGAPLSIKCVNRED
jgi:hypothetical protein